MSKKVTSADQVVGARIRLRRKQLGMSQERLGEILGITFQQIQKYENGVNRVGAVRLCVISKALGVPINYFFAGLSSVDSSSPEDEAPTPNLLSVPGASELLSAYGQIGNSRLRTVVLELAQGLARESRGSGSLAAAKRTAGPRRKSQVQ